MIQQLRHTGRPDLPPANAIVQFLAGSFAIVCGHSVDREGPGVHLGAAAGTLVGTQVEDAETFTLTACGGAAAIAAAFNTPLTGVVFVIEVLGIRYRVDRFIPIITASVTGALVGRALYGPNPAFFIASNIEMESLYELGLLALLGVFTGLMAVVSADLVARQMLSMESVFEHLRRITKKSTETMPHRQWRASAKQFRFRQSPNLPAV